MNEPFEPEQDESQEAELFQILNRFMEMPPDTLPSRAEIEKRYPVLASKIWRCLEGLNLFRGVTEDIKNAEDSKKSIDSNSVTVNLKTSPDIVTPALPYSKPSEFSTETGEPIGDFQLIREIGRGGMGVVYEARQRSLGRLVALKVLPFAATFDERQLQRFHNEAMAAAQLEHPGIVPIYAIGAERGIHFYAMKLIHGQHLADIIKDLRTSFERRGTTADSESVVATSQLSRLYSESRTSFYQCVAGFMKQAAEALDYAHQCGVIHRDIKPGNLMVDDQQRLWITDFGLAHIRTNVQLTQTGEVFGTPRYMSPEQALGKTRLTDHRMDIYSLGATFYEFLTLQPIFPEREQLTLLKRITQDEPVPPREIDPEIPHDFETIILKCIAKSPQDRYDTAGELAHDLGFFLENRPISARRPGAWDIVKKWSKRHPRVVWGAVLLLMFALGMLEWNHYVVAKERKNTEIALQEAQARFVKAREAADVLVNIVENDLGANNSPEQKKLRQKLLDTALGLYQDFLTMDALDSETEQQLIENRNYISLFMQTLSEMDGMAPFFCLMDPDVCSDLGITPAQAASIRDFNDRLRKRGENFFCVQKEKTSKERLEFMRESLRTCEKFMLDTLSIEQRKRLDQIELQRRPGLICSDEYAEKLKLTDEQRFRLCGNLREKPGWGHGRGRGPERNRNKCFNDCQEQIQHVLTPEQFEIWNELIGRRFIQREDAPLPPPRKNR